MSRTVASVLTPPGSAAIAVLSVRGPAAWPVLQRLFRTPAGQPLNKPPTQFRFGRLGDRSADEVILASVGPETFEIHCHGGPQVVAWLRKVLKANGIPEVPDEPPSEAHRLLPLARTIRTAGILLDQVHGAYARAVARIESGGPDAETVSQVLRRNASVGRHLVEPWRVAIAGLPNAGKSSLLNALAGFARSVVSPVPGTTRDAVSASLAFDGWPVDVTDTAGLRDTPDLLESEGVARARAAVQESDLVLWITDATGERPTTIPAVAESLGVPVERVVIVFNKIDLAAVPDDEVPAVARVSAATGAGLPELVARIAATLVPHPPAPGDPVPVTPDQWDRWQSR